MLHGGGYVADQHGISALLASLEQIQTEARARALQLTLYATLNNSPVIYCRDSSPVGAGFDF